MQSMFSKLEAVELRFVELEAELAREGLDGKELTRISKERASLEDIVTAYRLYREQLKGREEAREMLGDADPELRAMAKQELDDLEKAIHESEQNLQVLTLPKDPNDDKNVILEVRAGTGGEEAALFAADLYRMYCRYADRQGWRVETMSMTEASAGGIKEVIALISGDHVYRKLKFESGTHRVQRVPATEAQGRVHTSACTVAILPEADDVGDIELNPKDLDITVCRSSGAGGQHVNTTDSAVRIVHIPTGTVVECQDERSQIKNRERALKILKARLLERAQREQQEAISADRKSQVGSGDRSERIRTYNFPQGRLTDHRIGLTLYKLTDIINGDLQEIVDALATYHQSELLKHELDRA